ncbi:hypothetical protein BDW22DRAFT_1430064 [Trametopsis cervina]|nr:hypothetical protein BDW22DRAFT_1430064 [Trametopsis cervina]
MSTVRSGFQPPEKSSATRSALLIDRTSTRYETTAICLCLFFLPVQDIMTASRAPRTLPADMLPISEENSLGTPTQRGSHSKKARAVRNGVVLLAVGGPSCVRARTVLLPRDGDGVASSYETVVDLASRRSGHRSVQRYLRSVECEGQAWLRREEKEHRV